MESKELQKANNALAVLNETADKIDAIIAETLPVSTKSGLDFRESIIVAKGVSELRKVFLESPQIKHVINSMANTRLGFMTDRDPKLKNWKTGANNTPYPYEDLVDPIIEGLLKGYRITNYEICIIAGNFYAAKNGNYRRIVEYPGVSRFAYNNAPTQLLKDGVSAHVKCWATWMVGKDLCSIGVRPDDELILQIKVNKAMGEDAIVGKAHAKLFKRVLERITGQVQPETTDVVPDEVFGTVQEEKPGKPSAAADSLNARLKTEEAGESASIKEDIEERFSKDRKSTRLNSSHRDQPLISRMPSSA
jgi:hypothetical protein